MIENILLLERKEEETFTLERELQLEENDKKNCH